ncbi:MAG: lipid asymmetry maintenance protein MlaB [Polyangia bacterium]
MKNRPADNSLDAGIAIKGRPTLSEAGPILDAAIAAAAAAGEEVRVDCTSAEHLNGAVIQVLLCLKRDLERAGRKLVLTSVPPPIQRFVELSGLGPSPAPGRPHQESPANES